MKKQPYCSGTFISRNDPFAINIFIFILFVIFGVASCQPSGQVTLKSRPPLTGQVIQDVENLLPLGEFVFDLMSGTRSSEREQELTAKLQKAIQENLSWYMEYVSEVQPGEALQYHPNFGLTEEEYKELQELSRNVELVSTGTELVSILKKDHIITFETEELLSFLHNVQVDLKDTVIMINSRQLKLTDTIHVSTNTNALRSAWDGYEWRFTSPEDLTTVDFQDLENLDIVNYKCIIGRLQSSGKTFLTIEGVEFHNGQKELGLNYPLIF